PFQKILIARLPPPPSMVREQGRCDGQAQNQQRNATISDAHSFVHRTCRFSETTPDTGPPIAIDDSLASDSRKTCTETGPGRPSTMLICKSGTSANSLSPHNIVGEGTNTPTYSRSFRPSQFSSAIN